MTTKKYPLHVTNSQKYIEDKLAALYARRDALILKINKLQTKNKWLKFVLSDSLFL